MLCSKKMILPSKFNVKLPKKFGGGVQDLGQGGGVIFSQGGPGGYQHPVAMYADYAMHSGFKIDKEFPKVPQNIPWLFKNLLADNLWKMS
jgi:hypothetical protein